MAIFSKSFNTWQLANDERINLTRLESHGDTLEELLDNAEISLEDWNGNEYGITWTIGDLSSYDYSMVEFMLQSSLNNEDGETE